MLKSLLKISAICLFVITAYLLIYKVGFSSAYFTNQAIISGNSFHVEDGAEPVADVVINEFLPNPSGSDSAPMPDGEWVELYNRGGAAGNVSGWVLYDNVDTHELYITSSNTNTGNTVVPAGGFLVVYRNGDSDFNLDNSADSVRLYDGYPVGTSTLIDSYSYTGAIYCSLTPTPGSENYDDALGDCSGVPTGKSWARIPDGSSNWIDPIPTPGKPNKLEELDKIIKETKKAAKNILKDEEGKKKEYKITPIDNEKSLSEKELMEKDIIDKEIAPENQKAIVPKNVF